MDPNRPLVNDVNAPEPESLSGSTPMAVSSDEHQAKHGLVQAIFRNAPNASGSQSPFNFNRLGVMLTVGLLFVIAAIGVAVFIVGGKGFNSTSSSPYAIKGNGTQALTEANVQGYDQLLTPADKNLSINGAVAVNGAFTLAPSTAPGKPSAGQLYFDNVTRLLNYYNGTNFVALVQGANGAGGLNGKNGLNGVPGPPGPPGADATSGGGTNLPSDVAFTDKNNQVFSGGNQIFKNASDSSSAFQVQNAAGVSMLNADTGNSTISLGVNDKGAPVGYTTVGGVTDNGAPQTMAAYRVTASSPAAVTGISVYFRNADARPHDQFQVAIYSDGTGCGTTPVLAHCPGSLIASSASNTITAPGWDVAPISATMTGGTSYWLVVNENSPSGNLDLPVNNFGTGQFYVDASQTYGTWPSTYPTTGSFTSNASELSIFANTTGATPIPSLITDHSGNVAIGATTTDTGATLLVAAPNSSLTGLRVSGAAVVQSDGGNALVVSNSTGSAYTFMADTTDQKVAVGGVIDPNSATLQVFGNGTIKSDSAYAFQIQSGGGYDLLNADMANQVLTAGFAAAGTDVPIYSVHAWSSSNSNGVSVTPSQVGDLMAVATEIPDSTGSVTSVSGGGVTNWNLVNTVTDSVTHYEIWEGIVTSTGPSTITMNYASGASSRAIAAQEFGTGLGINTNWTVVNSGAGYDDTGTLPVAYPSLTATQSKELYWGDAGTASAAIAGSTPGFTYKVGANSGNMVAYNSNLSWGTPYAPTAPSAGIWGSIAMIVSATSATNTQTLTVNNTSASVAGNINVSGEYMVNGAQISSVNLYDGSDLAKLDGNQTFSGQNTFRNASNSATAFQVQDSSGTALLTADTVGMKLTVQALVINTTLTVNGHIISGGSTPTATVNSSHAGTGATCVVTGNDTAGKIIITTGSGTLAGANECTLTYAGAYASPPQITLTPANGNASVINLYSDSNANTTSSMDISFGSTPPGGTYAVYYHVIQ